jgi:hypothetical protein
MAMDEHDMMAEQQLYPWLDDPSCDASCDPSDEDNYDPVQDNYDPVADDPMDGDHESGFTSAGWGTDESYGLYGDDE